MRKKGITRRASKPLGGRKKKTKVKKRVKPEKENTLSEKKAQRKNKNKSEKTLKKNNEKVEKMNQKRQSANNLVEKHIRLVNWLVSRMGRTFSLTEDMQEEMRSVGYMSLIEAAERYDSSHGAAFASYCYKRIRGALF
ncbi:MAG: hypothetical protein D6780_07640, partial [Candidatus Dadabacteria bacterium]